VFGLRQALKASFIFYLSLFGEAMFLKYSSSFGDEASLSGEKASLFGENSSLFGEGTLTPLATNRLPQIHAMPVG